MSVSDASSVVALDADEVRAAVEAEVEGTLRSLVEYDDEGAFLALDPDERVEPVVRAVEDAVSSDDRGR
ncbi:hypothetical protein [Halorarum salinum]|uniref:Uncharacterized protein n=1 Tax=Halorarum salinum TaxID=2743089 RepID=A0A7D5L8L8_9EURY|nr:hypothetical protein [Halobaculum salinum]QLG60614.1 hypothetical protein HUG12_02180 [Halobaculum salinum]